MKLIYVVNSRIPTEKAHGYQMTKMCESFSDSRFKIGEAINVKFVVSKRINSIKEDVFNYYGLKNNFKLIYLPCLDLTRFNLSKFGMAMQMISFLIMVRIYIFFKKYDVFYTREQEFAGLFFNNYILEMHYFPRKITYFHKRCWEKAATLVVLTSHIKKELENYGVDGGKILVAQDGVDLDKFDLKISREDSRKKINLPLTDKLILYAGSFYFDWKGVDVLLEAEKYLDGKYLLILVGGNDEEIKSIKEKYSSARIILVPHQPQALIPYYLKAADVLVLPNKKGDKISEEYTSPLKLFEYMASGRPIVASDLPSIREILSESNAVLVEPNQPSELAVGIKKIINDQDLAARISRQARLDVIKYSWKNRAENILRFIQDKI